MTTFRIVINFFYVLSINLTDKICK